jgi:peptide-methionine (S)-S-oxide reductase
MKQFETATLSGGCFWCTEAIFQRLKGVKTVTSGYSGGRTDNPSYDQVTFGTTGHTEAIQIQFDPKKISYKTILEVFFKTHDPTSMNFQGADKGPQYASVIYYHTPGQKQTAEDIVAKIQPEFSKKIVTQIRKFTNFFKAEDYHQNYYNTNKGTAYCQLVIDPKIKKLYKEFGQLTRS